jgi:phosphoesterase RecJ-like protein
MIQANMKNNNPLHVQIRDMFKNAQKILIVSHIRPDGDAIGSLLGLGLSLEELGKEVQMVIKDHLSKNFKFLVGFDSIRKKSSNPFDLSIVLDSSDLKRTGNILNGLKPDLNIDHHITNENFARINYVEPQASATAEILTKNMSNWDLPITSPIANALLTGIINDTLGFRTSNVTSETLRIVADLIDQGADLPNSYYKSLIIRSFEAVRYWGAGLENIKRDGRLTWTKLTLEDRSRVSYPGRDDADLVNILASVEDTDISVIFIEQKNQDVKVSWRSRSGWDVSEIAYQFGGGGHKAASGALIKGKLKDVIHDVLRATKQVLTESIS